MNSSIGSVNGQMWQTPDCLFTDEASRHLYGNLCRDGFTIDWHNCKRGSTPSGQGQGLSLECGLQLCLNLSGEGEVQDQGHSFHFGSQCAFILSSTGKGSCIDRSSEHSHRYLMIGFSRQFLRAELNAAEVALHEQIRAVLNGDDTVCCGAESLPLTESHYQLIAGLLKIGCGQSSCVLRCRGLLLQLMADFFYGACCGNSIPCDRQKCLARERVQRVVAILQRDLAEPPTLDAIGREVGCSPYHLSRIFSKETGMTIPRYLQTLRLQQAAKLLRSGQCNVTEAAVSVGYSSLSHFSQVFYRALGCCPAEYSSHSSTDADDSLLHAVKAPELLQIQVASRSLQA